MNNEIIFFLTKLLSPNGVSTSIMRKMRYMEESWGIRPMLLLTKYDPNVWVRMAYLQSDWEDKPASLTHNACVVGMFEYLCDAYPLRKDIKTVVYKRCEPISGATYEEVEPNVYKVFMNGLHTETQSFNVSNGRLRTVERFNGSGVRINTTCFDDAGQIFRITVWDAKNPEFHPVEYYFSPEKKIRIQASYVWEPDIARVIDPFLILENDHNRPAQYILFDENEKPRKTIDSFFGLIAYCLDEMAAAKPDKKLVVVAEVPVHAKGIVLAKSRNIAKCCLFHNSFLENPNDINSSPPLVFRGLCENRKTFDGMIFLTNAERDDFAEKFESSDRYYVIPHAYADALAPVPFAKRDGRKVVIVARFDPVKRIEAAICIFKSVANMLDGVTLDIYGSGNNESDAENIKNHITSLGLGDRVFMKGPTSDPAAVFSSAAMSMMTSSSECLPLTLMESICNGCPAFAFDIKYGPSEIIKEGITGFIVQDNDAEAYTLKMIEFLSDENMRRTMSENCYADAKRFGRERFLKNWEEFINDMCERERN